MATDDNASVSDETKGAPGREPEDATDGADDWKARFEDVKSSRDKANRQIRELRAKLDELTGQLTNRADEEANKSKDIESVKAHFTKKEQEYQQKLTTLESRLRKHVVERQVKEYARELVREDLLDEFYALNADSFDVATDENGNEIAVLKGREYIAIGEFVKDFCDRKPVFAKNTRKAGGDVPSGRPEDRTKGNDLSVEKLTRMSSAEQQKALKGNLALAHELLKNVSLKQ